MSRVSYLPCLSWKLVPSLFGVYEPARAAVAARYTGDASKTRLSKINSVAPTTLRLSSTVIIMGLCMPSETRSRDNQLRTFQFPCGSAHAECQSFAMAGRDQALDRGSACRLRCI